MKVRAIDSVVIGLGDGTIVNVSDGQAFERTDQIVKEHPWLFERDNPEPAGDRRSR